MTPTLSPSAARTTHLGAHLARAISKPFHRFSPFSTAQSICIHRFLLLCRFLAQHPKNLPETMSPTTRDQLASCFIVPPSAPQYSPLAFPLSSGTYFSGRSIEKHPENCVANWITITSAQYLFTTPCVFDHQQTAKYASPTTSRTCFRRLREYTVNEGPNKRAAHTPQQIVGIGAPSLLSIFRPAALDVSPNRLTYSCTNSCARFCLNGATLHLRALLPSGIDITGS